MNPKIKKLWPLLVLLSLSLLFFWPLLFGGKTYLFGDLLTHHYPWKVFYSQSLAQGQLPLWASNMGLGYPLLASGEVGALYLPNLIIYYILPVTWAYHLSFLLHFFLGAVFMYCLARTLELSQASSLIAGITFAFSGFMAAQIMHLNIISAVVYLPLIFALLNLYFKNPQTLHLVGVAAVWALQFYAGAPAISFLTALAAALYVLIPSLWKSIEEKNFNYLRRDLIWGICTALLALLLAMGQILPYYELANFPWLRLQETSAQADEGFWGISYVGLIPLGLAFFGLGGPKSKVKIFFLILLVLAWIITLVKFTPLYKGVAHLPGFSLTTPFQFLALSTFSLAVLAGFGTERLLSAFSSFQKGSLRSSVFIALALLLTTVDLLLYGFFYNPLTPIKEIPHPPVNAYPLPKGQAALRRVYFPDIINVVPHVGDLFKRIIGQEMLLEKVLFLEEEPAAAYKSPPESFPAEKRGEILNLKYGEQKVELKVGMKQQGWLVLKDNYYPGWEAWVDGKQVKIYRGNYTMRAVFLEAGKHQVEFIYRPKIFKWGMIMTILGILVAVKLSWWSLRTQYKKIYSISHSC